MTVVILVAAAAWALLEAIKHHGPTDPPRHPHPMKEHHE